MINIEPTLAAGIIPLLKQFVMATKLHPILVNFTAALVPVSVASDILGRIRKNESLRSTAWWTLFFATIVTPFTALTGWLFWMGDDNGVTGMTIHKWLGTAMVVLLFGLFAWRWNLHKRQKWPTTAYFIVAAILVAVLGFQSHLGGEQVFSGM
jgi:uncharacterized membrane protein